jgi:hypothetical protein
MRKIIVQTRIPLTIRLWRSGKNYLAIVNGQRAIRELSRYLGREATLEFAGMTVRVRVTLLRQHDVPYIAFFLPTRMGPTWEAIKGKAGELDATLVIEEERVEGVEYYQGALTSAHNPRYT